MLSFIALALRIAVIGLFWSMLFGVGHFAFIGVNEITPATSGTANSMIIGVLFLAGFIVTERMMRLRVSFDDQQMRVGFGKRQSAAGQTAIEPEALRLRDMISLLDEDDLDDLRAEVREGLRDRIRNLTADESESFEDLLADAGTKRKRGAR